MLGLLFIQSFHGKDKERLVLPVIDLRNVNRSGEGAIGLLEKFRRRGYLAGLNLAEVIQIEILAFLERTPPAIFGCFSMHLVRAGFLHRSHGAAAGVSIFGGESAAEHLHFVYGALDRIGGIDRAVIVGDGVGAVLEISDFGILQSVDVEALEIARVPKPGDVHVGHQIERGLHVALVER